MAAMAIRAGVFQHLKLMCAPTSRDEEKKKSNKEGHVLFVVLFFIPSAVCCTFCFAFSSTFSIPRRVFWVAKFFLCVLHRN